MTAPSSASDYFQTRDGLTFAGLHLLIDLWGARGLDDIDLVERTLREAAEAASARVLHIHVHQFSPDGGLSGIAVLAESHISIHTWPARAFAALDLFMCGACDPHLSLPVLRRAFAPESFQLSEQRRGLIP